RERKKLEKLEHEAAVAASEAVRLRAEADLLLAGAHDVPRGATVVELPGFDGKPTKLQLDPALNAIDNAQERYAQARKRDRAAERLPALIAETRQNLARLEETLRRVHAGEPVELRAGPAARSRSSQGNEERLSYRRYRTSGGLEVRVGKNSRSNDELTLRHCSPNDIWMHARAVGGAHVVLRWDDPNGHPPKQDLIEAAVLAALHSKARHAGTTPIDWTRRKYVRKPRGAPPGTVMVERVKTLFVQPSAALEEKLRW
ncbi:MAG TPA: NFACT RNA binding domain-containing protein, partial [Longimicrobiales bacterium]|nr:NFACT RNA binding domain-containing protein [Longimicrobiales bacterium]